jgi:hypothetical protein
MSVPELGGLVVDGVGSALLGGLVANVEPDPVVVGARSSE